MKTDCVSLKGKLRIVLSLPSAQDSFRQYEPSKYL